MEQEIIQLTNKRETVVRRVENILHIAQEAQVNADKIPEFEIRYDSLSELISVFDSLHLDVVALMDPNSLEEQHTIQGNFDSLQYSIKSIYKQLVTENRTESPVPSSKSRAGSVASQGKEKQNVKLPRIAIPKFDGEIRQWPMFYDLFETLIHKNSSLSNIERFQYLVSYLEKDPLATIKNLPLTAENYKIAYESLVNRYQNNRLLMTNYWQGLSQASTMNNDSAISLRKLLSLFQENLAALNQFEHDLWDFTKFNWLLQKLDPTIKTRFELEFSQSEIPSFTDLFNFLERQCRALETSVLTNAKPKKTLTSYTNKEKSTISLVTNTSKVIDCLYCKNKDHSLLQCPDFLKLSPTERHGVAKDKKLCFNCLVPNHGGDKCKSKFSCRQCSRRHHTLLHFTSSSSKPSGDKPPENQVETEVQLKALTTTVPIHTVLFATALVNVRDNKGNQQKCRVLLDSASEANFISDPCVKKLGLSTISSSIPIQGLNQMSSSNSGIVTCRLSPVYEAQPEFEVKLLALPNICGNIPAGNVVDQKWSHLKGLQLADPFYATSGPIDILLGAEMYAKILLHGLKKGYREQPSAINTVFGWVIIGKVGRPSPKVVNSFYTSVESSVDLTLRQFWEIEEIPSSGTLQSVDDITCENHFLATHSRTESGRYIVELPFRDGKPNLGDSYHLALRRFLLLENRLVKNPSLYESYSSFMRDYLDQDHMSVASTSLVNSDLVYYIPHHCVFKPESTTSKIRVVFDASAKSSNGVSLNDSLLTGPKLQNDICSILLVFRLHAIAFTADVRQMYRQLLVADHHRDYQRILWRFSTSQPVQEFRLNTVTYGVSSSPYLAIRSLLQLAHDEGDKYPLAAEVIKSSLYVDDVVTGSNSREIAIEMQSQLIELFSKGGFELRKWTSNDPSLLTTVPEVHQQPLVFSSNTPVALKVLGLQWCPLTDSFTYTVEPMERPCTKRNVLSELSRIYDPLGLLSPLTLLAKWFMQSLWTQGLDWDDQPSLEFRQRWSDYQSQFTSLTSLSIPRLLLVNNVQSIELHGFCDASEVGYAGVIYFREVSETGDVRVFLVCAKAKVAPLKRISIPRLELCASVLLSDLIEFVLSVYKSHISVNKIYAWSDSTVTLQWIRSSPHRWKTFVANRVSHIHGKVPPDCWHHINGTDNPADCASRGLMPHDLLSHSLWWAGPSWLGQPHETWAPSQVENISLAEVTEEQRQVVYLTVINANDFTKTIETLLTKFSSLAKIQRIIAHCQRFIFNCVQKDPSKQKTGAFSDSELYQALVAIVRVVQREVFRTEILQIQNKELCSKPLRKLSPFLGDNNVLRVGGRLRHSELCYDAKHPMLLPRDHRLTELIIEYMHVKYLHPGLRTLQFLITQQFWILSPRRAITRVLSRCYRCFKVRPQPSVPSMGDLPAVRISQVKCFSHSGVDFAGPILVTPVRRRGSRPTKAYICVFVCMTTKAIHLELVSSLSSDAFLAALRRFVARRGRCSDIYSDCGTNFVGANKLLNSYMSKAVQDCGITWHFNPPSAPHFGGLWEAGVNSTKTHLKRVIGTQILTFEELTTVLAEIEALLNSRPLCELTNDPNDLNVLTPGHFLTMEPLTAPPDEDVTALKLNRLDRWQLIQRMHQDFWHRWHIEYLHTLQQRSKWHKNLNLPGIGDLVLIRDELHPPLYWQTGRILNLSYGHDGIPRVAGVRTSKGTLQRPLVKLCPLPSQ